MCRRNTGLSVHRTADRTSPTSTNQIGDRVHGARGNHFAGDRANQLVLCAISSVDESPAKLGNSKVFSKLDARVLAASARRRVTPVNDLHHATSIDYHSGSVPLWRCSSELCIKFWKVLEESYICYMDDRYSHSRRRSSRTRKASGSSPWSHPRSWNHTERSLTFVGHIIDRSGIQADPRKTIPVKNFPTPTTVKEL